MADYKKMYLKLFNKITDVIEELQEVQKQIEDLYIDSLEPNIVISTKIGKNDPETNVNE